MLFRKMLFREADRSPAESLGMLVGRVLLSALFIWAGYGKLMTAAATKAAFAKMGLPLPDLAYLVAVVVELGGGLLLLVGLFTRPVAVALGLWCIVTALVAHTNFADRNQAIHFMKNVTAAGGFAYVAALGAGLYSLDARLFRRRRLSIKI